VRWLTVALKVLSGLVGLVAAVLWFMSASGKLPLAPGAELGGTLPTDPFNVALRQAAQWNRWAAGATGTSVLLMVVAELIDAFGPRGLSRKLVARDSA